MVSFTQHADEVIQKKYFPEIRFSDERERQVFLSYIRGFNQLVFDPSLKKIVEIGGGQSTALLATLGARVDWEIHTIDINPEAIKNKLRSQQVTDETLERVHFYQGASISLNSIKKYYSGRIPKISGIELAKVLESSKEFINCTMDSRKAPKVAEVFRLKNFDVDAFLQEILKSKSIPLELLNVFKSPGNELEFEEKKEICVNSYLYELMVKGNIDAVFLDSGEFSSLPEWEIVSENIRVGGYVILHDIFFPKSFKNWLVCGSIVARKDYEVLYVDGSTPQGLMIAQKVKI